MTALYTAGVWEWARVEGAARFAGPDTRAVFRWVNRFLALARFLRPKLPSLPHSLAHRHQIIDHLAGLEPESLLVELGVGLCPRPLVWAKRGRRCVEVDLPPVMQGRLSRLARGAGPAGSLPAVPRSIEGDLLDPDSFSFAVDARATIVIEGVLPYFTSTDRETIWSHLHHCLARVGGRLIFDLTPEAELPRPGWVGRILGWLMRRFTGGRSFVRGHRTREEVREALERVGFVQVVCFDQADPPPDCLLASGPLPTQTVVFSAQAEASA